MKAARLSVGVMLVIAFAALIRLPGLSTELWLDELVSLQNATSIAHWWEVFTRLVQDNTHHTNSLWLFLLGGDRSAWIYRLPAYVGSVVAVTAAYRIGLRESRAAGILSAVAIGGSFLLIYYASEARGYGLLTGAVLVAWWRLLLFADTRSWRDAAGFWAASVVALLSHPTTVWFLIGAYVWTDARVSRTRLQRGTRDTWRAFVVPGAAALVFYVVALRGQEMLGGPRWTPGALLAQTLSAAGSGPLSGPFMWVCGAAVAALMIVSVADARKQGDDRWVFYGLTGIIVPAAVVFAQPTILFPRYFIIPVALLLLPVASYLSRRPPAVAVTIAIVYFAAAVGGVIRLSEGRTHHAAAIQLITAGGPTRVTTYPEHDGGHAWRTSVLMRHYGGPHVTLVAPSEQSDWLIVEGIDSTGEIPGYVVRGRFPAHPFTAPAWTVYGRADSMPGK